MSIYEYVDPTVTQMDELFWSLLPVVAEQAGVTTADALYHMRRAWNDRIKAYKAHEAIDFRDDGRAAAWRVRLIIWRTDNHGQAQDRVADSDPRARFDTLDIAPGETIIYGLPAVATWALELITACHAERDPAGALEGVDAAGLAARIKSLRVALSNSGGNSVWRIRYSVSTPAPEPAEAAPGAPPRHVAGTPRLQHFCAYVYVQREETTRSRR